MGRPVPLQTPGAHSVVFNAAQAIPLPVESMRWLIQSPVRRPTTNPLVATLPAPTIQPAGPHAHTLGPDCQLWYTGDEEQSCEHGSCWDQIAWANCEPCGIEPLDPDYYTPAAKPPTVRDRLWWARYKIRRTVRNHLGKHGLFARDFAHRRLFVTRRSRGGGLDFEIHNYAGTRYVSAGISSRTAHRWWATSVTFYLDYNRGRHGAIGDAIFGWLPSKRWSSHDRAIRKQRARRANRNHH
jgi:hypothetical protein